MLERFGKCDWQGYGVPGSSRNFCCRLNGKFRENISCFILTEVLTFFLQTIVTSYLKVDFSFSRLNCTYVYGITILLKGEFQLPWKHAPKITTAEKSIFINFFYKVVKAWSFVFIVWFPISKKIRCPLLLRSSSASADNISRISSNRPFERKN